MGKFMFASFGFFIFVLVAGYVAFDFHMVNQRAKNAGDPTVTFGTYVANIRELVTIEVDDTPEDPALRAPSEKLLAMMPPAPEGWTVAPAVPEDIALFDLTPAPVEDPGFEFAFEQKLKPGEEAARLKAMLSPREGKGVQDARQTYRGPGGAIAIELIRWPDGIFTSYFSTGEKYRLRGLSTAKGGRDFMTVRGLTIREYRLSEMGNVRYLVAHIGGQLHLRVLAPKAIPESQLAAVLGGLDVLAMNADAVEPIEKISADAPNVMFFTEAEKKRAEEKARRAENKAKREAEFAALLAENEARNREAAGLPPKDDAAAAEGGVTIRRGASGADAGFGGDCAQVSGFKSCAVVAPD